MSNNNVFSLKTFCLITGASKGLGRAIAINFAKKLPPESFMMLLARSKEGLTGTTSLLQKAAPKIKVAIYPVDLGMQNTESLKKIMNDTFLNNSISAKDFQQAIIVHNAGSMGDVSHNLIEHSNTEQLKSYWDLNLTSVISLNSVFHSHFNLENPKQMITVHISSICALQPFKSWSLYCAGKAARDMLFRTMAEENPDMRVLNYAPGPLDTDMQVEARTLTGNEELKNMFVDMKSGGKLLTCDESVEKLIYILQKNKYHSGAHIDYYDVS